MTQAEKDLARIKKALPKTYYAALTLPERIEMMVGHWKHAIKVNKDLETLIEVQDQQLTAMQECSGWSLDADETP